MVTVALVSAKGSPGATTSALALSAAWPDATSGRRVLLVEADAGGGDILAGYLAGTVAGSRGLLSLTVARNEDPAAAIWEQVLSLDEHGYRLLLPGLLDARQAVNLEQAWSALTVGVPALQEKDPGLDVLLDQGRLRTQHEGVHLRALAHHIVLVTRSSLSAVASARSAAAYLAGSGPEVVSCLVVDPGDPYSASEVAESISLPLLGALPFDRTGAGVFAGRRQMPDRQVSRTPLVRAARQIVSKLRDSDASAHRSFVAGVAHV